MSNQPTVVRPDVFRVIIAASAFQATYGLLKYSRNVLETYDHLRKEKHSRVVKWLKETPDPGRIALLDSGAFGAWNSGSVIDLDSYIAFIKANEDIFTHYVGLDCIPGSPGVIPNAKMVEESAQKGWDNFMRVLDAGIPRDKVIHVHHQGESMKWLEKLVLFHQSFKDGKIGYIGLSPANDRTTPQRVFYLDSCMPYVTDSQGEATIRFHGFAVTSPTLMRRFPWTTCDSASAVRHAAYGNILVPNHEGSYLDDMILICVSKRSGETQAERHYDGLTETEQKKVRDYVETYGYDLEAAQTEVAVRAHICISYYQRCQDAINKAGNQWKRRPQAAFV